MSVGDRVKRRIRSLVMAYFILGVFAWVLGDLPMPLGPVVGVLLGASAWMVEETGGFAFLERKRR